MKTYSVIKVIKNRPRAFFRLGMKHKPINAVFHEFKRASMPTVVAKRCKPRNLSDAIAPAAAAWDDR